MTTTLRRGQKLDPPEMPSGQLVLQAPPELQPHEGAGNALMTALPMLGSVGSIVFVAAVPRGCVIVFLRVHLTAQVCAIAGTCRTTLSRLLGNI